MIRNFLFDVGNVLIHCDLKFGSSRIATRSKRSAENIQQELIEHPILNEFDLGLHTSEAFNAKMQALTGWCGSVDELEAIWQDMLSPDEDMFDYMESLVERGYHSYILSNCNPFHTQYIRQKFPGITATHGQIFSNECSLVKPDEAIFIHAQTTFGIEPSETFFIDDRLANVRAAERLGFVGLVHTSFESTKRKIESMLSI
ncbi:MAG TPA: HAD family phosphatase [Candidatus Kapabacteria bacterium]|jgi:putative hydrolase of the HAD superfamily|nr:HAD family phosphatase [Candidatus Kapabacteria bacterium]